MLGFAGPCRSGREGNASTTKAQGRITHEYKAALQEHGLKNYYGDDAGIQPGTLQELLLHETAAAWIRRRETVTQIKKPWTETPEQYGQRLRGICQYINDNFEMENLCRELPMRLDDLIKRDGDRINK